MHLLLLFIAMCCVSLQSFAQFTATITASGPTTFCQGDSVYLIANANADTYQWYSNGTAITNADDDTLLVNASGTYEVTVDSAGNINTSLPQVITVNTVPAQPGPISGPTLVCQGSTYTYSVAAVPGATSYAWGGSNPSWMNFSATTTLPTHSGPAGSAEFPYTTPDATVMVYAINGCGQSPVNSLTVSAITPRNLNGMNNDPDITQYVSEAYICPTGNNELNAFSHSNMGYCPAPTFQWYRNNVPVPGATNYSLYIQKGGSYKVILNTGNGACVQTIQKVPVHQVAPLPLSIDVLTPQPMCQGGVTLLKVNWDFDGYDGTGYYWALVRNDTPMWYSGNVDYLVVSNPGAYKIGLSGYFYNNLLQCPSTQVFANVNVSGAQAAPVAITQNGNDLNATAGFISYQWFKNYAPITGATNSTYTFTTWGSYFVLATDGNGCMSQSNIVLSVNSTVSQINDLTVSPNPNTGTFNIAANIPPENRKARLTITDITGRDILRKDIAVKNGTVEEQMQLDDSYPSGLYFLKLTAEGFSKTTSFIKQ